jgi:hypothetical protein
MPLDQDTTPQSEGDQGQEASGEQMTINSGGDVAGGNIDKRQGKLFVEHSTIHGNAIGEQHIHLPSLPPALHQLRAPIGDFVGREREIGELVAALSKAASGGAVAAINGVRGLGGIGKTELAYAVAQRLMGHFPGAQLVVNLRGASASPLPVAQALGQIIHAFTPDAKLPDDSQALQQHYCAVLYGQHALILADDARDAAQVRELLPPAGCALLVTSRNRFSLPGMAALDLGVLPPEEAEKLLLEICPRIGEQAPGLARLCGYLPLALRISAGLLANSSRSVGRYLEQLAAERLAHLADPDDLAASVEASLRLSYDALERAAQTALAQMSVFGASFDQTAALAVVEVEDDAEALVDMLGRRSLLEWDATAERYTLHDLVRVFAAARLEDADAVRLRHGRHYVQVASHAQFDLYLRGDALAGLALFDREHAHIDAGWGWAMVHAGEQDADALLLDYPNALYALANLRYDLRRERIPHLEAQRAAAQRIGRRDHEGYALGNLGIAYADLGDAHKAITFHEQCLTIARELGDRRGEGTAWATWGLPTPL